MILGDLKLLGLLAVLVDLGLCTTKDTTGSKDDPKAAKTKLGAEGGAYGLFMERFRPALVAQVENSAPMGFNSLMKLNVTLGRQTRQKDGKGTEFYAVLPEENVLLSGSLLRRGAEEEPKVICSKSKGKTTCRVGRFTFVIKNGEQSFSEESIKKLVGLMYRRSQLEEKVAEEAPKAEEVAAAEEAGSKKDSSSAAITVDCSVLEGNTSNNATLECEWSNLGLKKRYLVSGENVAELNPLEKAGEKKCSDTLFIHTTPLHVRGFGPECVCSTDSCIWHLTYPCPVKCSPTPTSCCDRCGEEDLCAEICKVTGTAPPPGSPTGAPGTGGSHAGPAAHGAHPGAGVKEQAKAPAPKAPSKVNAAMGAGPSPKKIGGKVRYERRKRHVRHHHH